jgi:hypothetical protein
MPEHFLPPQLSTTEEAMVVGGDRHCPQPLVPASAAEVRQSAMVAENSRDKDTVLQPLEHAFGL